MNTTERQSEAPEAAATTVSRSSFYLAMRILAPEQRQAMYEVYAFCRAVDDIADEPGPRDARRAQLQRWRDDRSTKAKPTGGSTSPLERHSEWLLDLIATQPDMTLNEIVTAMRKQRIPGSRTAVWRFFERHNITVKKNPTRE